MDFMKAIKAVLNDSRIVAKLGIIFGILIISSAITTILNLFINFTSYIPLSEEYTYLSSLFSLLISLVAPLLTFPLWLYMRGYALEIADSIRKGNLEDPLPEHSNIKRTLSIGGVSLTISYVVILPFILLISAPIFLLMLGLYSDPTFFSSPVMIAILFGLLFIGIASGFTILLVSLFFTPTMTYIYIRTGSVSKAFSMRTVFRILAESWSQWLLYAALVFLLNIIAGILTLLLCCIPVFAPAAIQTFVFALTSAILGSIYYNLDQNQDRIL